MSKFSNASPLPSLHDTTSSSTVDSPGTGGFFPRSRPGMKQSFRYEPRQGAFSTPNRPVHPTEYTSNMPLSEPRSRNYAYQQSDPGAYLTSANELSPRSRTRELAQRIEERRQRRRQQITEDRSMANSKSLHDDSASRSYASRSTFQPNYHRVMDDRSAFTPKSPRSYHSNERNHLEFPDGYPRAGAVSDFVTTYRQEPLSPHSLRQHRLVESRLKDQLASNSRPWRARSVSPGRRSVTSSTKESSSQFQSRFYQAAMSASSPARNKTSEDILSKLMSRLSSVDRSNPEQALREIDELLRQESMQKGSTVEPDPSLMEEESMASSDDETSVSSITNPTYQPKPQHDLFPKVSKSKNKLIGYAVKNGDKSRPKKSTSPPPPMIAMKDKKPKEYPLFVGDVNTSQDTGIVVEEDRVQRREFQSTRPNQKAIDHHSNPKLTLVEKDQGDILFTTTSDDLGSIVTPRESPRSRSITPPKRRSHPWDSELPVASGTVDVRDTSADSNAIGVEAMYLPKYAVNNGKIYPESPARDLRRERLTKQNNGDHRSRANNTSSESISLGVTNSIVEQQAEMQPTTRSFAAPKAKSEAMTGAYDDEWVALPESSYFHKRYQNQTENYHASHIDRAAANHRRSHQRQSTNPFDDSIASSQDLDVATTKRNPSTNPFEETSHESGEMNTGGVTMGKSHNPFDEDSTNSGVSRTRYDNFNPQAAQTTTNPCSSISEFATSKPDIDSASKWDQRPTQPYFSSATSSSTNNNTSGNTTRTGFLGLFQRRKSPGKGGEFEVGRIGESVVRTVPLASSPSRGRSFSKSPSRSRAHSLEDRQIRNPNLAKKLGNVLRVYDSDDRGGKAVF